MDRKWGLANKEIRYVLSQSQLTIIAKIRENLTNNYPLEAQYSLRPRTQIMRSPRTDRVRRVRRIRRVRRVRRIHRICRDRVCAACKIPR